MLSALTIAMLMQIPITGNSAFTRVPYNTPLGYGLANRQPPLGWYQFSPPGIANPKVIELPRPMPVVIDEDAFIGTVIAANAKDRTMSIRLDDGEIHNFDLSPGVQWVDKVGRFELRLGKTRVALTNNTVTILQ